MANIDALAQKLETLGGTYAFSAKVMNNGARAMLMLPPRAKFPQIPMGETVVIVNGRAVVAKFAKIAVNVILEDGANVLTAIARGWFGPDAGRPGTKNHVAFVTIDGALHMVPVRTSVETEEAA